MSKIVAANLPMSATEESIRTLFERHGSVKDVVMTNDRSTGRPRGIAFIVMSTRDAICAIQNLNGHEMDGSVLVVGEAGDEPRNDGYGLRS
jgi:RNA recognition motif-containing protein